MDQHPIPQDVTGFQFKLIGSMTVKQFGYVAVGVIAAVILYYLPLQGFVGVLIKILFIPLFGGTGVFIAFVPIEGRPVDVMTGNFLKAVTSPNQYIYRKQGRRLNFLNITTTKPVTKTAAKTVGKLDKGQLQATQTKQQKLEAYLFNTNHVAKTDVDKQEAAFLKTFSSIATPAATIQPAIPAVPVLKKTVPVAIQTTAPVAPAAKTMPVAKPTPIGQEKPTPDLLAKEELLLAQQLSAAKQTEATTHDPVTTNTAHQKVQELEDQVKKVHEQKLQLEQELTKLKEQLASQKIAPTTTPPAVVKAPLPAPAKPVITAPQPIITPAPVAKVVPAPQPAPPAVKIISQKERARIDLPAVSDTPNVVIGIVKDPRGNILPNILVEVKDSSGNPVRAFKTNALGQFASATPLANGVYTIELDDPKKLHQFDVLQLSANGQILMPIEILSHDAREQLRKELFN